MSTTADNILGRARAAGSNFWAIILAVALLVFLVNAGYSLFKSSRYSSASGAVADLQVLSQQYANLSRAAVDGKPDAFKNLKTVREDIQKAINEVDSRYGSEGPVSADIARVKATWAPLAKGGDAIINSESVLTGLSGNAEKFSNRIPDLQAQLNEVVAGLSNGGAPAAQQQIAMRQIVLASGMGRRIAEIRAGGAGAPVAGNGLRQDSGLFDQIMTSLREGGVMAAKVTTGAAVAPLNKATLMWSEMKKDLDAILGNSRQLFDAQSASDKIGTGADKLLADSRKLFSSFTASGSLKDTNILGNVWITLLAGALAVLSLVFLLVNQYRAQAQRRAAVEELNARNQQAIMRLLDEMGSLAEGDLTVKATVTEDVTGAIADSINFAIEQLRSLVGTINDTSVQVAAGAQETQNTALNLAEAAEHQSQEITHASDRISEIATNINQVSRNSAQSAEVARKSVEIATNGAGVVRQTIVGMDNIRDQIQETSKRIKRLGESSQEIGSIVELINDISEQTNILALNASIQAASAGEAGRGFAVVADEVQRLAERASRATKRIEGLVHTIQSDTNEAVSSMEQTTTEVVRGARLAEDAGTALGEIERVSSDLANLIQNISHSAEQQSSAASNITQTMDTIRSITAQTSQGASQTAQSIGTLAQLATDLRRSVADFKLPA
ncbi:MAG: methyl-accepting chemotaxis protein [Xanthomonadales bacterium]|nr:methyl-accepting chemotaxis protein [Xanthomonadales bacterium]